MPKEIVEKLNEEIIKALDAPEVRKKLDQESIETEKMSPEAFTKFVESEIGRWGPIAKQVVSQTQ